jgi:cytochrome c556
MSCRAVCANGTRRLFVRRNPRNVYFVAALLTTFGVAIAADDLASQRQALMVANELAANKITNLLHVDFKPDDARIALQTIETNLVAFVALFPEGGDQTDTKVQPAIWQNLDDLKARAAKTGALLKVAEDTLPQGPAAFKLAWQAASITCKSCHKHYVRGDEYLNAPD